MRKERRRLLDGLEEELNDHIEREIEANLERGMSQEEARHEALKKFGNVALVKEDSRAVWIPVWLDQVVQDLRYAIRSLLKHPAIAGVVVLTLGIAIGASTIIFSTIDVIWHFVPVEQPHRLVFVTSTDVRFAQTRAGTSGGLARVGVSIPDLVDWSSQTTTVEEFAAFGGLWPRLPAWTFQSEYWPMK